MQGRWCVAGHGEFGEVQLARLRNPSEETPGEEVPPDPDSLVMVKVRTCDHHSNTLGPL